MSELVLLYVVNAAIQATLVAAVTLLATAALRRAPARIRFALVTAALAVAAVTPAIAPRLSQATLGAGIVDVTPTPAAATIVAIVYIAGAAAAMVRLMAAAARARRILRSSQPFDRDVRLSDGIAAPMTIGSHILIPRALAGSALLPAALAHERAHVRRRDFALNALLELIAVPLWFHPAAFLLRRELAVLREMACDEEAARQNGTRQYAAALVELAAFVARRDAFAIGVAATAIERRLHVLRRGAVSPRATRAAILAAVLVPAALMFACTRVALPAPATLCGIWRLVPEASHFRGMRPSHYDEYTQWIAQGARTLHVRQRRVAGGRAEERSWSVVTDGQWRAIDGIPGVTGRATWRDGRLAMELHGPGAQLRDQPPVAPGGAADGAGDAFDGAPPPVGDHAPAVLLGAAAGHAPLPQIGRASCRERV